jgi:serine/threonine protein kinase/tetratricopeptide (TPR) repeat protein
MSIAPGTRFGPYEFVSLIGTGGMGEVYRAHDPRLGRDVAIKTIAPQLAQDPDALARFQREARAIAKVSHPNILAIYDVGCESSTWFVVTELLDGETLLGRLKNGPLPWQEAVRIGIEVAEGLASAHARFLVHRDIKPANIFLTSDGRVKLLDFGLARQNSMTAPTDAGTGAQTVRDLTQPGFVAGTVAYMSPEQIQGRTVDGRSDIFSVGCVLYEILTGESPFRGESAAETMAAILKDPMHPVRGVPMPAKLQQTLVRCLQKNRELRFQAATDVAAALRELLTATAVIVDSHRTEPARPIVAVLPFRSLSADPENDFFADGVTEDVIAHLAKIRSLDVISRTSVTPFKKHDLSLHEIGRRLGATRVVEGSVRRFGNRVRIVADLIAVQEDRHLWAETYDRDLNDIFAIQTDVALQIANALRAELSADELSRINKPPTRSLEAYELFLQGRQHAVRYTEEGLRQSIQSFEDAIQLDPDFALAYVGIARTYAEAVVGGNLALKPVDAFALANDAIAKALAADDRLGDAHGIVALIKFTSEFDWVGAEREFKLALELSPGSADIHDYYGWLCSSLGRSDDAMRLLERASELDPLAHRTDIASELLRAGRFEDALAVALRVIETAPELGRGHSTAGWAYLNIGRAPEGIRSLERAVAAAPGSTMFLAQLGEAYGLTGDRERARAVLDKLQELARNSYVAPYHFAYVHAGLGEDDAAMDYLEQAYEQRSGAIYGIKRSFLFANLRTHPRFAALLKKMNLA